MNEPQLDETFSAALRDVLVTRVESAVPAKKRQHRRLWLGAGVFAGAGLLGGIGAAAAGILVLPGSDAVSTLAAPVIETHMGTATVDLGPLPAGGTNVAVQFTCLTPGQFVFGDGSSIQCYAADIGTVSARSSASHPLAKGQHTVTITTGPDAAWTLTATYVKQTITAWAVNAHGQSYGIQNANGTPDLVAVIATNGKPGYARSTDLSEADGTNAVKTFKNPQDALAWQDAHQGKTTSVPVYQSDGTTLLGEFVIGGP